MLPDLAIFVLLGAAIPAAVPRGRPWDALQRAKAFLVSGVEWFGELGMFCARLMRAALTPPYSSTST